ncbi:MAG TPA: peptide chain release factor 2 [Candidatus Saccharimonadales bacterium]|nr:peptide chain release factor 2 [Candidatus Saccharimonadales bacterium]
MEELQKQVAELLTEVERAIRQLKISERSEELQKLTAKSEAAAFWSDKQLAQDTMKQISSLEASTRSWLDLQKSLKEVEELAHTGDTSLLNDLQKQLETAERSFDELKESLKFTGPYDSHNVILSIYAGAGGTDAQDWTQMLLRMYTRFADKQKFSIKTIDESPGEEAGIKSVTLEVNGEFAYGQLKSEHGVHRLVRLSPFNTTHTRETSFAKVDILPKVDKPEEVEIDEKDLKIDVYRSGGHGGQSVNTTDSAVRVTHIPTGITVAIQNERSQLQNKETALTILRSKLAQLQLEQHKEQVAELKGPNEQAAWGNQIRSYVIHPYKQVKDLRTGYESKDPDKVLDGDLNGFIQAYLEHNLTGVG